MSKLMHNRRNRGWRWDCSAYGRGTLK